MISTRTKGSWTIRKMTQSMAIYKLELNKKNLLKIFYDKFFNHLRISYILIIYFDKIHPFSYSSSLSSVLAQTQDKQLAEVPMNISKLMLATSIPQSLPFQDPPAVIPYLLLQTSPGTGQGFPFPQQSGPYITQSVRLHQSLHPSWSWAHLLLFHPFHPHMAHVHSGLPDISVSTCFLPYIYNRNLNIIGTLMSSSFLCLSFCSPSLLLLPYMLLLIASLLKNLKLEIQLYNDTSIQCCPFALPLTLPCPLLPFKLMASFSSCTFSLSHKHKDKATGVYYDKARPCEKVLL